MWKRWMRDENLRLVLGVFLLLKIGVLVVVYLAFRLLPFCVVCHGGNFVYPPKEQITAGVAYKTWDGQHYLYLAERWYSPDHISNGFFPLFPATIRVVAGLTGGNYWWAGMLLGQGLSIVAVILFYLLVKRLFFREIAMRSVLLFMAFPTAFYLHLAYSEGLFLVLALGFFYSLYSGRFWGAIVCAGLLPLSREPGVTLMLPLLVFLYGTKKAVFSPWKRVALVMVLVVGWIAYMVIMKSATGELSAMRLYRTHFVANYSLTHLLHPIAWFQKNFWQLKPTINGFNTSLITRTFFGVFVVVFCWGLRKIDRVLVSYMVMTAWLPALSGFFMGYPRFLLVVFPLFVILAKLLGKKYLLLVVPMLVLQSLFVVMHSLNYWVA